MSPSDGRGVTSWKVENQTDSASCDRRETVTCVHTSSLSLTGSPGFVHLAVHTVVHMMWMRVGSARADEPTTSTSRGKLRWKAPARWGDAATRGLWASYMSVVCRPWLGVRAGAP